MPSLRAIWKETAETSMRVPIGRVAKRGDEAPRRVDTGEGSVARTGRKRVWFAESDADDDRSWESEVEGESEVWTSKCLRTGLAAGSGVEVISTSFQP